MPTSVTASAATGGDGNEKPSQLPMILTSIGRGEATSRESWYADSSTTTTLPRKTPRCRQRRNPTRATTVPSRRPPIVHRETRTVLTPTISVVSQPVRIETIPRSMAAFHRSKLEANAAETRTRPTIVTRVALRVIQTLPLTPRLRGSGGGSPEGRRRLPLPPGPRCGVTLRLGAAPAPSVAIG